VTVVEPYRSTPARLRSGHRTRETVIQGLPADARLRRVVDATGRVQPLAPTGLVLSAVLAGKLQVAVGDSLEVDILDGERRQGSLVVAGVVDDFLGVSAYMNLDALQTFVGGTPLVSGAFLAVHGDALAGLQRRLKLMPAVAGVASPDTMLASFKKQMDESLFVGVGFLVGFASVIAVAVVYNGARVSLSERARELASLRVMGFRRREVSGLLLGEQALITLLAIPIGWLLGHGMSSWLVRAMQTDTYRIPFIVSSQTYLIAAAIVIAAAAASAMLVQRRINRLDLIELLKTRE
jgi:putative ABC transport system permease protein